MITFIIVSACLLALFSYLKSKNEFWKKKGVPQTNPVLFFGDLFDAIQMKKSLGQVYSSIYNKFSDFSYVGAYKMRDPVIVLRDPELFQKVLITNFQSFHDNEWILDEKYDPLFAKNPFFIKGEKWKTVRNQIIPCFSSGKMKAIFPIMQVSAQKLLDHIEEESKIVGETGMDSKTLCTKYTTENVVNCSYGLEANCFKDPNSEFMKMGDDIFKPSTLKGLMQLCVLLFPSLSNTLNIRMLPDYINHYFRKIVNDILQYRSENNIKRNDYIDILLEVKNKDKTFNNEDISAHALGLFTDGTETSATALSFILYELAANPQKQEILREEAEEVAANEITYESIMGMPYLEAVIHESLRMHPPAPFNLKITTEAFTFPPAKEGFQPVTVLPGTPIVLPYAAIHRDEKHFPNPTEFEPERFLSERKNEVKKNTFMPFGDGPRACIGMRFAILQIKIALFYLALNYEMRVSNKTLQPLEIDPNYFLLAAKGGMWLKFYKRKQ